MAVEALSRRDATLLTAEGALKFLFQTLKEQNGIFAEEFFEAMQTRINERRNKDLVTLLRYLQNKDLSDSDGLPLSSKKSIHKLAADLSVLLFTETECDIDFEFDANATNEYGNSSQGGSDCGDADVAGRLVGDNDNLQNRLSNAIAAATAANITSNPMVPEIRKIVKQELLMYENSNQLGTNLIKLLTALKSVRPTSTESERVFSLSNFC